jgi:hypothetical protein
VRQKKGQSDKLAIDARSLSILIDEERQKDSALKFQHSQLSSEILRVQLNRKRYEQELGAEAEPSIDLAPLQKKKKSLIEQTSLVQAKCQAFEQELEETVDTLERLRIRHQELKEIADKAEMIDVAGLKKRILQGAAENVDLRSYLPVPSDAERLLEELAQMSEASASLISRSQLEFP